MEESKLVKALDDIKAGVDFRKRMKDELNAQGKTAPRKKWMLYAAALAASLLLVTWVAWPAPVASPADASAFKIIGTDSDDSACYIMAVFIDGYSYYSSSWHHINANDLKKGEKLGEVTLDLKGLRYTGVPPDFSSTLDVGTEIYAVQGLKPEYAVLAVDGIYQNVLYRQHKVQTDYTQELGLSVAEIIAMLTADPALIAVDLLDEENGSLMRRTTDQDLLALFERDLLDQPILGGDPGPYQSRIPINLVFPGGEALHMQLYPDFGIASTFGGYVQFSPELTAAVQDLADAGVQFPAIAAMLPFSEDEIGYLHYANHRNKEEICPEEVRWTREPLFTILRYCRLEKAQSEAYKELAITVELGRTEQDSVPVHFYNSVEGLLVELHGQLYRLVQGSYDVKKQIESAFKDY
ncbi:MAG: hypothetical protein ACOX2G_11615 [Bacillota bacterium]|jgi:hypothetical protein